MSGPKNSPDGKHIWTGTEWKLHEKSSMIADIHPVETKTVDKSEISLENIGKFRCPDCGWRGDIPKRNWWHDLGVRHSGVCPVCPEDQTPIFARRLIPDTKRSLVILAHLDEDEFVKATKNWRISAIIGKGIFSIFFLFMLVRAAIRVNG